MANRPAAVWNTARRVLQIVAPSPTLSTRLNTKPNPTEVGEGALRSWPLRCHSIGSREDSKRTLAPYIHFPRVLKDPVTGGSLAHAVLLGPFPC